MSMRFAVSSACFSGASRMRRRRMVMALAASAALGGCAGRACPIAGTQPMTMVTLYFGQDIAGHGTVTDAQWAGFAATVIGRQFPDGFTVFDARGQWRNPATGAVGSEPTKVVQIALPIAVDPRPGIAAIEESYKQQYHQLAVGMITTTGCGAF